eukprot:1051374-Rhodomonas_salina.2
MAAIIREGGQLFARGGNYSRGGSNYSRGGANLEDVEESLDEDHRVPLLLVPLLPHVIATIVP